MLALRIVLKYGSLVFLIGMVVAAWLSGHADPYVKDDYQNRLVKVVIVGAVVLVIWLADYLIFSRNAKDAPSEEGALGVAQ